MACTLQGRVFFTCISHIWKQVTSTGQTLSDQMVCDEFEKLFPHTCDLQQGYTVNTCTNFKAILGVVIPAPPSNLANIPILWSNSMQIHGCMYTHACACFHNYTYVHTHIHKYVYTYIQSWIHPSILAGVPLLKRKGPRTTPLTEQVVYNWNWQRLIAGLPVFVRTPFDDLCQNVNGERVTEVWQKWRSSRSTLLLSILLQGGYVARLI